MPGVWNAGAVPFVGVAGNCSLCGSIGAAMAGGKAAGIFPKPPSKRRNLPDVCSPKNGPPQGNPRLKKIRGLMKS